MAFLPMSLEIEIAFCIISNCRDNPTIRTAPCAALTFGRFDLSLINLASAASTAPCRWCSEIVIALLGRPLRAP